MALLSVTMLIIGCVIRLIDPINIPLQIVGTIVSNIGLGLFTSTLPAMLSDNADAVSDSMGFRAEGAIFSLSSFIAKITMGVGGAIPGYVLAAVGYQAGAAAQTSGVNNAIIMMLLVLPIVLYAISGLAFGFAYKINSKPQQNQ